MYQTNLKYTAGTPSKYPQSSTGKERGSESGFCYFGARYYDSDLMTGWLSVDPQSDKFPNISPYNYCNWNPVKLVDQDGEAPVKAFVTAAKLVKKAYNIYKKTGNLTMKSLKKAGSDELVGIVDDINTIFSGDASLTDRIAAGVDLLVGIELNNKGAKKSLSITGVKKGPPPNGGKSKPHGGYRHNEEIDNVIKSIPKNAKSIRKNQVQVDVNGNKVGNNRPDVQYDYEGKHYVIEIDNRKRSSTMHEKTIQQNDPK